MCNCIFSNQPDADSFSIPMDAVGKISATETRDGITYYNVLFPGVEVCGIPSDKFTILNN